MRIYICFKQAKYLAKYSSNPFKKHYINHHETSYLNIQRTWPLWSESFHKVYLSHYYFPGWPFFQSHDICIPLELTSEMASSRDEVWPSYGFLFAFFIYAFIVKHEVLGLLKMPRIGPFKLKITVSKTVFVVFNNPCAMGISLRDMHKSHYSGLLLAF